MSSTTVWHTLSILFYLCENIRFFCDFHETIEKSQRQLEYAESERFHHISWVTMVSSMYRVDTLFFFFEYIGFSPCARLIILTHSSLSLESSEDVNCELHDQSFNQSLALLCAQGVQPTLYLQAAEIFGKLGGSVRSYPHLSPLVLFILEIIEINLCDHRT